MFGAGAAGQQVVLDLVEPGKHFWVYGEHGASQACLTCPMFVTTPEFLPQHREHRQHVLQLITAAEARGQQRLVEMNQQVLGNLDRIITTLHIDSEAGDSQREAADAC